MPVPLCTGGTVYSAPPGFPVFAFPLGFLLINHLPHPLDVVNEGRLCQLGEDADVHKKWQWGLVKVIGELQQQVQVKVVALCNGHVNVGAGTVASLGPAAVHQHGLDLGVLSKDGRDDAAVGSCQSEFHWPSDSLC